MPTGLTPDSVDAAIKLMTAAKNMGVQTFRLGEFQVSFLGDAVDLNSPVRQMGPSALAGGNPLFDDPDMWATVQSR